MHLLNEKCLFSEIAQSLFLECLVDEVIAEQLLSQMFFIVETFNLWEI